MDMQFVDDKTLHQYPLSALEYFSTQPVMLAGFAFMAVLLFVLI